MDTLNVHSVAESRGIGRRRAERAIACARVAVGPVTCALAEGDLT